MMLLIIVLELMAIAANLLLPLSQDATLRNRAAAIARDMQRVRTASIHARAGRATWAPSPRANEPPPEVTSELPADFTFEHEDYQLVWERWSVADPASLGLKSENVAGVTVVATEPRLAGLVASALAAGEIHFTNANRTTLVIDP